MAKLSKVAVAQRQENIPGGVDKNILVRAYEFDAVVDRLNSITTADNTIDLNGTADALILDADGDTTISAPTDDQIDVEVGGSDVIAISANRLLAGISLLSSDDTGGVGYSAGAGGAVTQATSITTGVTLNKITGKITTVSATLTAGVDATFRVTNSTVEAADTIVCHTSSYGGTADGIPVTNVISVGAGQFDLNIRNTGAVALDAVVVISFSVIKGVAA